MQEQLIENARRVVGTHFDLEYYSKWRRYVVFSADENLIDDEEISRIIAQLMANGFFPQIHKEAGKILIHVSSWPASRKKPRAWLNLALFIFTVFTTMMAGAGLIGKDYFADFSNIIYGWKYSLAVLLILTAHEFGHYFAAQYHKIKATLPYYIPLPLPGFHFGTLGAFIKMKSPIQNRIALLDVGAAGPIAGFVMSLFFLILGYHQLPDFQGIMDYIETIHPLDAGEVGINLYLGKSLLFSFFNDVLAGGMLPMNEIYHFPYIFAGWIGFLVTAINLIPIGQLDGGHILYSLVGKRARLVGVSAFALLIILNFFLILQYFSFVWVVWIILIFVLIGFRHPPTVNDRIALEKSRQLIGWICLGLFILCFPPLPLFIQ